MLMKDVDEELPDWLVAQKRWGLPQEIADMASFVCLHAVKGPSLSNVSLSCYHRKPPSALDLSMQSMGAGLLSCTSIECTLTHA